MSCQPRLHHGRSKSVNDVSMKIRLLELCAATLGNTPQGLAALCQIRLLPQPIQHLQPVLERRRVPILGRQPVPDRNHDHIAQLGDPPTEDIVRRARIAPSDEPAPVELEDHGELPTTT